MPWTENNRRVARRLVPLLLRLVPIVLLLPAWTCRAAGPWKASAGIATDYVLRGVSQTYDSAAVQLGGSYQSPLGWFVGAWGSNVNPYPHGGSSAELDLYLGAFHTIGDDFSGRVAYTHYAYLDDPRQTPYAYDEVSVSATYLDMLSATVSYAPNSTSYSQLGLAQHRALETFEITGRYPLRAGFAVTGGVGYYDLQSLFGVSYWAENIGLSYVHDRMSLQVDHFFADRTVNRLYGEQSANGTWALSILLRF